MSWKWQTNKNSPFRGSQGRIIELMSHHQICLTNRKAQQLFLLLCTLSVRLQLSDDLSASRFLEAPGPLPDARVGAVPITVVSCRDLRCCSRDLLGQLLSLGITAPTAPITTEIPDVFSQLLLFLRFLLTLLTTDFFLTIPCYFLCVGVVWHFLLLFEFMTRENSKYLRRDELYSTFILRCALLFTAVAK